MDAVDLRNREWLDGLNRQRDKLSDEKKARAIELVSLFIMGQPIDSTKWQEIQSLYSETHS